MASAVDICNLALSRLGDTASVLAIDPPEDSAQAVHCARFYPVARDTLLERHAWGFATRRVALSPLVTDDLLGWQYSYTVPADMLRAVSVLANGWNAPQPFEVERDTSGVTVILTDTADAVLRYTMCVTDTTKFTALFVDALGWLLASYLAGPIIKGDAGAAMAKTCLQAFQATYAAAAASDANQRHVEDEHTPAWIGVR